MSGRDVEDRVLAPVFPKKPLEIDHGEGAYLVATDGTRYLDLGANYSVANIGHAHPRVAEAVERQARRLTHLAQTLYSPERARFLETLQPLLPRATPRVYLSNSGAEAMESALKYARAATRRKGFVAARNSFHGRTLGAVSLTWRPSYREPFEPLLPGVTFVPFNDPGAFDAAVNDDTAAVVLEPVQGEGGVTPATADYFRAARQACDDHGALLVVDEIQTGLGRTGRWWGHEHFGVRPDLVTIGKSIAGGLPMGVTAMREDVAAAMPKGAHGNTFGGSPLVCAAATAALEVLRDEDLPARAASEGEHALGRLRAIEAPLVRDVRGLGLMIGLELRIKPQPVLEALMARRVLALQAGTTVLRLLPPLNIPRPALDEGIDILGDVLRRTPLQASTAPAEA